MKSEKPIAAPNVGGSLTDVTAAVLDQQNINLKKEIPDNAVMVNSEILPSKGVAYKKPIYVTPLTTQDLKNLNTMTEENATARINGVLFSCIHGISYKDILEGDKLWLLFYIRSVTYDDFPIFIKYKCKECGRQGVHKVTMKNLNVRHLKDDYVPTLELPKCGDKLTLRLPSIRNEDRANSLKNNEQFNQSLDPELLDLCIYIEALNDEEVKTFDAYQYLLKMNAYDFSVYSNYLLDYNFGIVPSVEIPCACGTTVVEGIGFTSDFFMPNFSKYKDL